MNYITIELSKQGNKHAGKFTTIVDAIDSDLAELNWSVQNKRWKYAYHKTSKSEGRKSVFIHQVVMERILGRKLIKGEYVDHIDGDGLNNTRLNLRLATNAQNAWNQGKHMRNTSGYKGVYRHGNKWQANIGVNYKIIHLGVFGTKEEAYEAYCEAAKQYHGEFANFGNKE